MGKNRASKSTLAQGIAPTPAATSPVTPVPAGDSGGLPLSDSPPGFPPLAAAAALGAGSGSDSGTEDEAGTPTSGVGPSAAPSSADIQALVGQMQQQLSLIQQQQREIQELKDAVANGGPTAPSPPWAIDDRRSQSLGRILSENAAFVEHITGGASRLPCAIPMDPDLLSSCSIQVDDDVTAGFAARAPGAVKEGVWTKAVQMYRSFVDGFIRGAAVANDVNLIAQLLGEVDPDTPGLAEVTSRLDLVYGALCALTQRMSMGMTAEAVYGAVDATSARSLNRSAATDTSLATALAKRAHPAFQKPFASLFAAQMASGSKPAKDHTTERDSKTDARGRSGDRDKTRPPGSPGRERLRRERLAEKGSADAKPGRVTVPPSDSRKAAGGGAAP